MNIQKSLLYTFFFFLFVQVTAIWVSLNSITDIQFLIDDYNYFVSATIELIGIIIFFFVIKEQRKLIPKRTSIIYYILAVICAALYAFFQKWLNYVYDIIAGTDFASNTTYDFNFEPNKFTFNLFAIVVLLPIAEELFFRGYIQNGLQKNYKPLVSIGTSSLLFTLLHLPNIHHTYLVFFGGLISAILYFKSKSITPSIIFHIIWNLLVNFS